MEKNDMVAQHSLLSVFSTHDSGANKLYFGGPPWTVGDCLIEWEGKLLSTPVMTYYCNLML